MNYYNIIIDLLKETLLFRNYKRLNVLFRVLVSIALAPMIIVYTVILFELLLLGICTKLIEAPLDFLNSFVKDEGKEVKHATQFIIYFFGFPLIFLCYTSLAFNIFSIQVLYLVASLVGYIATLGGIEFSPFIMDRNNQKKEYSTEPFNKTRLIVFVSIAIPLSLLVISLIIDIFTELVFYLDENLFWLRIFNIIYTLFGSIYVPIAFKKKEINNDEIKALVD